MRQMRWELRGKKGRGRTAIAGEKEMGLLGTGRGHIRTVLGLLWEKGGRDALEEYIRIGRGGGVVG